MHRARRIKPTNPNFPFLFDHVNTTEDYSNSVRFHSHSIAVKIGTANYYSAPVRKQILLLTKFNRRRALCVRVGETISWDNASMQTKTVHMQREFPSSNTHRGVWLIVRSLPAGLCSDADDSCVLLTHLHTNKPILPTIFHCAPRQILEWNHYVQFVLKTVCHLQYIEVGNCCWMFNSNGWHLDFIVYVYVHINKIFI